MDYSRMDDMQKQRLSHEKFVEAFIEKTIPQAEYWELFEKLYPQEYESPQPIQAMKPPVMPIQHLEQPSAPVGSNLFSAPTVGIRSEPYCTIHPSVNLVNFPVHRQRSRNPCPVTIEDAVKALSFDGGFDDFESMKACVILNIVEFNLTVMVQSPKELAKFFPVSLSNFLMSQLEADVRQGRLIAGGYYLLNLLRQYPGLQEKITPDLLFNCNMQRRHLVANLNDAQDTQLRLDLNDCLGWDHLHYPFLHYATMNDLQAPTQNNLLAKAYSLAAKLNINTDDPFTESINLGDFVYNSKFAISTTDFIRPQNLLFHDVYGEHGSIRQVLFPIFGVNGTSYLPVTSVSCPGEMPKMMFLPQNNMPLVGLNNLLYRNDKHIFLTPRISTAVNNQWLSDTTVLSWWGGVDTIDLVDWSPLTGKTVYYLLLVQDFGGNEDAMLKCWVKTTEKLESINCTVNFIHMKQSPANPNSQYLTDSGWQQNNQNSSNGHLY